MMGTLITCWISVLFPSFRAVWLIGNDPFPRVDGQMAVGAYNGSIFIIGGYFAPNSLAEFNIATESLTDHGYNAITQSTIHGAAQYWTQQGSIIYIIDNDVFDIYDMSTNQCTNKWKKITFTTSVGDDGCLASSELFLYVSGGDPDGIDTLQILSLTTYSWIDNPPNMQQRRQHHSCVFHNDYLWAFGGQWTPSKNNVELATNERIQAADITGTQNTWNYIGSLTLAVENHRAVAYHDTIYVIGAQDGDSVTYDFVHLVDANTGTVTISGDRMQSMNQYSAPIIVDGILYAFGGFEVNGDLSTQWQYYPLDITTGDPTEIPTVAPIAAPTKQPTSAPIAAPTEQPTSVPIAASTEHPTFAPIVVSTEHPLSQDPTVIPIVSPTDHPIVASSEQSTAAPIDSRTNHPSFVPSNNPIETIYPSKQVTKNANEYIYTSQSVIENEGEREDDPDPVYESTQNELVSTHHYNDPLLGISIGAASMLIIIALITYACFVYYKKKGSKQDAQGIIIQMAKAHTVVSATTTRHDTWSCASNTTRGNTTTGNTTTGNTTTGHMLNVNEQRVNQIMNVMKQMKGERGEEEGERDHDLMEAEAEESGDSDLLYGSGRPSLAMVTPQSPLGNKDGKQEEEEGGDVNSLTNWNYMTNNQ